MPLMPDIFDLPLYDDARRTTVSSRVTENLIDSPVRVPNSKQSSTPDTTSNKIRPLPAG